MRRAFVLIRLEPGAEGEVLEALEEIPEVKEVHQIYGAYGIIIRVEAETEQMLKDVVALKIRRLDKVVSALWYHRVEGG